MTYRTDSGETLEDLIYGLTRWGKTDLPGRCLVCELPYAAGASVRGVGLQGWQCRQCSPARDATALAMAKVRGTDYALIAELRRAGEVQETELSTKS